MARTPKPSLFPRELLEQANEARRDYFRAYTVAHPTLATVDRTVWNAIHEPAGALLIMVIGPTGVGKTTLLEHLEQRLCEEALPRLEQDPGHLPVVKLLAATPAPRQFKWADFFTRCLLAVREPLVDYKVNPQAEALKTHISSFTPKNRSDAATLQLSWEHALHYRRPIAVLIDEAQHLGKIGRGSSLLDQLDYLKSLAILTNTVYVLAGTYELLAFRNLSAQLSRRSIDIHFPRYQATNKEDVRAFKTVLQAFQRHLPLEEMPDLVSQWQECYTCTAGCIGIFKEWLLKALAEAVETKAKTISPELLAHHAPSLARREQMLTEIEEGEEGFTSDEAAEDALRKRMGLPRRRKTKEESTTPKEADEEPKVSNRRTPSIGQRLPAHDPVKGGVETDGESGKRIV
jgi:energy-coupling factor transporter ATP-binding protein EcfA2